MSGQPGLGSEDTRQKSALEEYEQSGEGRPPFILTYTEVKLLGIAGVRAVLRPSCLRLLLIYLSGWLFLGW